MYLGLDHLTCLKNSTYLKRDDSFFYSSLVSFGNFTFEMLMFKSGHFREYYTEYPIGPIDLDAEIFLEVSLRTSHAGLVLFLDECKATPTTDYDNEAEYFFIEDG